LLQSLRVRTAVRVVAPGLRRFRGRHDTLLLGCTGLPRGQVCHRAACRAVRRAGARRPSKVQSTAKWQPLGGRQSDRRQRAAAATYRSIMASAGVNGHPKPTSICCRGSSVPKSLFALPVSSILPRGPAPAEPPLRPRAGAAAPLPVTRRHRLLRLQRNLSAAAAVVPPWRTPHRQYYQCARRHGRSPYDH
jgi:hypothetical protein